MNNIVTLTDEQISLFNCNATVLQYDGRYMFLPFWFKDLGDNNYEMIAIEDLPTDIGNIIGDRYNLYNKEAIIK